MKTDALNGFLAGYFHQDWDVEFSDAYAAADHFGRSADTAAVLITVAEIGELVASEPEDWESVLSKAGCYYRPTDVAIPAWLLTVAARAARAAVAVTDPQRSRPA